MTRLKGFTDQLQTAEDLLGKLWSDLGQMRSNPFDARAAWDFFVTAEHLPEWIGEEHPLRHRDVKHGGNRLLLTACHLGTGAKHYWATRVEKRVGAFGTRDGAFQPGVFDALSFDTGGLTIEHEGYDGQPAGWTELVRIAYDVYQFWARELGVSTPG